MVDTISDTRLKEIAAIPQEEWESYSMDTQCVKLAWPTSNFVGKTLKDIIAAHIAMDKELSPREGGAPNVGLWPDAFVVVTNEDIEDHGLLFVYGFKPYSQSREPRMGKFYFKPDDMCNILASLSLSAEELDILHETYDMDAAKADSSDDEGA